MNASSSITLSSVSSEPYPKTCSLTIPEGRTGLHPVWEGVLGVRTTWKKKQILLKKTFYTTIQAELCDRPHSSSSLRPRYPVLRGGQTPPRVEDSNRPIGRAIEMTHSVCVDRKMSKKTAARPACPFTASSSRGLPSPSPQGASVVRWTLAGTQTFPSLEEKGHGRTEYGQGQRERGGCRRPGHSLSEQVVEIGIQSPKQEWCWWWFSR